ncbi:MAG TPA: response regulator [Bryobacteraceae bacterium]|nr:response regulator [Bryobacteraceae bacterium]
MNRPDPALLQIFAAEQGELLSRMRLLIQGPGLDPAAVEGIMRSAHTLKGAARAAGVECTETLTHALEGLFATLRTGATEWGPEVQTLAAHTLDNIEDCLASIVARREPPEIAGILRELQRYRGTGETLAQPAAPTAPEQPPEPLLPGEFVRLPGSALDELMRTSSELVAAAAAGDIEDPAGVARAESSYRGWSRRRQEAVPALKSRQHDPAFAPVLECIQEADLQLRLLVNEIRSEAVRQRSRQWEFALMAERLEDSILHVRMVSADSVFGSFGPMLRALAQEEGRQVDYRAEGLELPADRAVLQALKDSVLHLLRNAVSHGIEPEDARVSAGKPPAGVIRLLFRSQGERLQVIVEDDGRGLDREALAREAVRQGLLEHAAERPAEDLAELIFRPGFSTSSKLTTLSGRGMGLAVVRHEVSRLQGDIHVSSIPRRGTTITISVPLSLSSQQVLLVSASGHKFGFVTSNVNRLLRLRPVDIHTVQGQTSVIVDTKAVPLYRLGSLLDVPGAEEAPAAEMGCAIVEAGQQMCALAVDELIDVLDTVIKPLGLPEDAVPLSSGGVALPNGEVAVILKAVDVVELGRRSGRSATSFAPPEAPKRSARILVVDDSLTTRSLERSVLESHGYEVILAVNGKEALDRLSRQTVQLVITDIAMPEMDGFELLQRIRQNKDWSAIPVIVVSSLESREDQERGLDLGADAYIVKRKFDQRELLNTVRQIL